MFKALTLIIFVLLVASVTADQSATQTCDICKYVVQTAEKYVNESEQAIEQALMKACTYLPAQLETLCDTIVLVYGKSIVQLILNKETPEVACAQVKLCPTNTTALQDSAYLVRTEVVESVKIDQFITLRERAENSVKCSLCTFVVSSLENLISSNKTEQQIEKEMEKLCSFLPQSYSDQCKAIIDEYLPYLIYYVKEKLPADKICSAIGLCTSAIESTPQCGVCQYVIAQVEKAIPENATEEQVITALNQVCQTVPLFKAQCIAFVQTYASQAVHLIMQRAPPQQVCQFLKVCDSSSTIEPSMVLLDEIKRA